MQVLLISATLAKSQMPTLTSQQSFQLVDVFSHRMIYLIFSPFHSPLFENIAIAALKIRTKRQARPKELSQLFHADTS